MQKNKLEFVCILDWEGLNWWGFGVQRFKVLDWALNNCTMVIKGRRKLHRGALALGFWLKSAISNQDIMSINGCSNEEVLAIDHHPKTQAKVFKHMTFWLIICVQLQNG